MDFGHIQYDQRPAINRVDLFDGLCELNLPSIWSQMLRKEYGGWLNHVAFFTREDDFWRHGREGPPERSVVQAYVLGAASDLGPVTGSAAWTGTMVAAGVDRDAIYQDFFRGRALIAVDFGAMTVAVAFTDIRDVRFQEPVEGIAWDSLPLSSNGAFGSETIQGRFFGPGHEEVAGVFDRNDLFGAFGAKRD